MNQAKTVLVNVNNKEPAKKFFTKMGFGELWLDTLVEKLPTFENVVPMIYTKD
jgi:hypothetical protein